MSRRDIRRFATRVREGLGLDDVPYVDISKLLEFILPKAVDGFTYDVRTMTEMRENHGLTNVHAKTIVLREDVYEGMCDGHGRDRMTVAHEIGHLLLHGNDRIMHRKGLRKPPAYRDPEWQAKAFAGEFLVSEIFVNNYRSISEVAEGFGVSHDAAAYQLKRLQEDGIIKGPT